MLAFTLRRLAQGIPLLLGVVVLLFVLLQLMPGDPVQALVGGYPVPPSYRHAIAEQFHLDDPLWSRFVAYVGQLAQGKLGYSFASHQSVAGLVLDRLPATLLLVGAGIVASSVGGVLAGTVAAMTGSRKLDGAINTSVLIAFAVPSFWLGQMLILFLSVRLGWFPTQGMQSIASTSTGAAIVGDRLWYLALPALALCARQLATVTRVTRASVRETLTQDYIVTAELKGLHRRQIIGRHVLRNSMLPVVTVIGYQCGLALAGTVLIERVFSWPGIGSLLLQAIAQRDNSLIIGVVLVIAVLVILINLVTDLVYGMLDPRIRRAT